MPKKDIYRTPLKTKDSGTSSRPKERKREIKQFPDKGYDPMKLFRQRLDDNNKKNAPRHLQRECDVAEQEHNYPGPSKDRYKHIKAFLKNQKK